MAKFLSFYKYGDSDGDGYGTLYTNWDGKKLYGCTCDPGYFGASCKSRMCPMGDDPETTGQNDYIITITVSASAAISGQLTLFFQGHHTTFQAHGASESSSSCVIFIEELDNIEVATCTQGSVTSNTGATTYVVTIKNWPMFPKLNNHFQHNGNPSQAEWICDVSKASAASGSVTCSVAVTQQGTKEYAPCSNRGICDSDLGLCACGSGYMGADCSQISSLVTVSCAGTNLLVKSECHAYNGTVLSVESTKAMATDFKLISTTANDVNIFDVRGDGLTTVYQGGMYVSLGGQTITHGLVVDAGGFTIDTGGLYIKDGGGFFSTKSATTPSATVLASHNSFASDVLSVSTTRTSDVGFNLLMASHNTNQPAVQISGNGHMQIHTGGLQIDTVGLTIAAGGLNVREGQTIHSGGLQVPTNGATVTAGGFHVTDGGSTITHSAQTVPVATLYAPDESSYTGTVLKVTSAKAGATDFNLIRLDAAGSTQWVLNGEGKVTNSNGFLVEAGGVTINAGGLHVRDGQTITTGGLIISTAGATVSTGGYVIDDGGAVIGNYGSNTNDVATVRATHATYTGSIVHVKSDRTADLDTISLMEGRSGSNLGAADSVRFHVDGLGNMVSASTTTATSTVTGSIIAAGGVGIAKQIYAGGIVSVRAAPTSTSSTTGSIVTAGGMGIAKDLYVGGILVVETGTQVGPNLIIGDTEFVTHDDTPGTTTTFKLLRSRGTYNSPAVVQNNDYLGELKYESFDGTNYNNAVGITGVAEAVGSNSLGSKIVMSTSTSNGNSLVDRVEINMVGQLKVLTDTEAVSSESGSFGTAGGAGIAKSIYTAGRIVSHRVHSGVGVTLVDSVVLMHTASNTAANGIGVGIDAYITHSSSTNVKIGAIDTKLTDVTSSSEDAQMDFQVRTGGSFGKTLQLDGEKMYFPGTVDSTSATTGSLIISGGMGVTKSIYAGGQIVASMDDSGNETVVDLLVLGRSTSAVSPGNGIGAGIQFGVEVSEGGAQEIGSIDMKLSSVSNGAEAATLEVLVQDTSNIAAALTASGAGVVLTGTTESTTSSTGSLVTGGGMGVVNSIYSAGKIVAHVEDTVNNAVSDVLIASHTIAGSASTGIGVGISLNVEGASGSIVNTGNIQTKFTDVTNNAETAGIEFHVVHGGTMNLGLTVAETTVTNAGSCIVTGATSFDGNLILGDALEDGLTFTGRIRQGIVFEGTTSDSHRTTLHVVDPTTASKTSTLRDASGLVISTGNLLDISDTGTLTSLTIGTGGALNANGDVTLGQAGDTLTVKGMVQGTNALTFHGNSNVDSKETTVAIADQSANQALVLPPVTGTIITTGNMGTDITAVGNMQSLTISGAVALNGGLTVGDNAADTLAINAVIQNFETGKAIKFKGSSSEINLGLDDPTADHTINIPTGLASNAGTVVSTGNLDSITSVGTLTTLSVSGATTFAGSTTLAGNITVKGAIQTWADGNGALIFAGASDVDNNEATLKLIGPTADRLIKLPDADGTIVTTGNFVDITNTGVLTSLTVSGVSTFNGNTAIGNGASDAITVNSVIQGTSPMVFEGTAGGQKMTLSLDNPTTARTITVPYQTDGTIITNGNPTDVTVTGTLVDLTVSGTTNLYGSSTALGDSSGDAITIAAKLQTTNAMVFKASAGASGKITLAVPNPTSTKTVSIPDVTGTIITQGNLGSITPTTLNLATLTASGTVALEGNVEIGTSTSQSVTIAGRIVSNGVVTGESSAALVFQAGDSYVANTYSYLTLVEPTGTHVLTVPANSGRVITTANLDEITTTDTGLPSLTVTGTTELQGSTAIGSNGKTITFGGQIKSLSYDSNNLKSTALKLDGATTGDSNYVEVVLEDESSTRTITLPNCDGTIITTGNLGQISTTGTQSQMTVNGASNINGNVVVGDAVADSVTLSGKVIGGSAFVFEGAAPDDNFETTLGLSNPGSARTTTFRSGGTAITEGNLASGITGTIGTVTTATTVTNTLAAGFITVNGKGSGNDNKGVTQFTVDLSSISIAAGACHTITHSNSLISTSSIVMPSVVAVAGGIKVFVTVQSVTSGTAKLGICNLHGSSATGGAGSSVTIGVTLY